MSECDQKCIFIMQEVYFAMFFIRKEMQFLKQHVMFRISYNGHNPEPRNIKLRGNETLMHFLNDEYCNMGKEIPFTTLFTSLCVLALLTVPTFCTMLCPHTYVSFLHHVLSA